MIFNPELSMLGWYERLYPMELWHQSDLSKLEKEMSETDRYPLLRRLGVHPIRKVPDRTNSSDPGNIPPAGPGPQSWVGSGARRPGGGLTGLDCPIKPQKGLSFGNLWRRFGRSKTTGGELRADSLMQQRVNREWPRCRRSCSGHHLNFISKSPKGFPKKVTTPERTSDEEIHGLLL